MRGLASISKRQMLYLSLMLGGMALGFGKWILFSSLLEPAEFGLYTTFITTIAFLSYFGVFGLNEYLIKEGTKLAARGQLAKLFQLRDTFLLESLFTSVIVLVICIAVDQLFDLWTLNALERFSLCGLLLVTSVFNITDASLRAALRSLPFAGMVFLRASVLLIIGYVVASSYGLSGILLAELGATILSVLFAFYKVGPKPTFRVKAISIELFLKHANHGISFLGLQSFRYLSFAMDKWIVGWFIGSIALGYYSFLLITYLAFVSLAGVYNAIMIPRMIARFEGDSNVIDLYRAINSQCIYFGSFSLLVLPFYLTVAEFLVRWLFPHYEQENLVLCIFFIYVGSVLHVAHHLFDSFFYMLGRQRDLMVISAAMLAVFLGSYLLAGFVMPGVTAFCFAFLLSKMVLILTTFWFFCNAYRTSLLEQE